MASSYNSAATFASGSSAYYHHHHQPQQQQYQYNAFAPGVSYSTQQMALVGIHGQEEDEDGQPTVNMAGFGARHFAQRQEEARRQAERERQRLEEENKSMLAEQRYYDARRIQKEEEYQWQEEQKRIQREALEAAQKQQEYQQWNHRQAEEQRGEDRRQRRSKAMASSSSPLARSIPLPQHHQTGSISPSLRELRLKDTTLRSMGRSKTSISSASSDAFWIPGTRSSHAPSNSASSGSSTSYSSSRLQPIARASVRETVYEDDYEEPDGFGGMKTKPPQLNQSRIPSEEEELPLAKCASCGESLPFEELVGHNCINVSDCKSPLFTRSEVNTPLMESAPEMARGGSAPSRSPFFDRYAEVVEKSSSPLLQNSSTILPIPNSPLPRDWSSSSPSLSSTTNKSEDAAKRVEQLRKDRIRQIEEQRMAKKLLNAKGVSPRPEGEYSYVPTLHNRDAGSTSSSSMSSTKSSLLGSNRCYLGTTPPTENLTPSSSFEYSDIPLEKRSHKEAENTIKQARAARMDKTIKTNIVKKGGVNIEGIENLLKDIHSDDSIPLKSKVSSTPFSSSDSSSSRPSGLNLTHVSRSRKHASKTCSVCLQTFHNKQPMVQKDGKIFCIDDYAELYLEKCRKCTRPVRDVGVRSKDGALSGLYHRECFSCFRCSAAFEDGTFYVFDNAPYCSKHYHNLNGTTCQSCKQGIEGKCRQLESGERFHPRCLTCQYDNGSEFCKDTLTDYYLFKEKRLCEWHFGKVQARLERHGEKASASAAAARLKASKRRTIIQTFEARKGKA